MLQTTPEPEQLDSCRCSGNCKHKEPIPYRKEVMSDSTRSCSPGDQLTCSDFGCEKQEDLPFSGHAILPKQYASEKKKRKLTLKELHQQKNVKWKEFDCFKIEETRRQGTSGQKESGEGKGRGKKKGLINFEKALNFPGKNMSSKGKGTKPINPKIGGNMGMTMGSYSFASNVNVGRRGHEDFGYFAQSQKYKTEICKNFELKGKCKWGENCCFAHGKAELRKKTLFNYFYKTKICKHFHKNGYCPYASRCQYFHFKTFQKFQELLESFSNKLYLRIKEDNGESLFNILDRTGKV